MRPVILTPSLVNRFWQHVVKPENPNDCWIWHGALNKGYGVLQGGRNVGVFMAHRISYTIAYGQIPENKPHICHKCDNPKCVNPSHLYAGTDADNAADRVARHRQSGGGYANWGEHHGLHKLTDEQINEIRCLYASGDYSQSEIAKLFGVTPSHISRVVRYHCRPK